VTTAPDRARSGLPRRPRGDAGSVAPWGVVRLAVLLAVLGALAYDAGSVALAALNVQTTADDSLTAASVAWQRSKNVDVAYQAALARAVQDHRTIGPDHFTVGPDGTVALQIRGTAHTLLLSRIGPLRSWAVVTADASGGNSLRLG
jgi:hypothetical protein